MVGVVERRGEHSKTSPGPPTDARGEVARGGGGEGGGRGKGEE